MSMGVFVFVGMLLVKGLAGNDVAVLDELEE